MSIAVSTAVWEGSKSHGKSRIVMLYLAERADDQGVCWPSLGAISRACHVSVRGAQMILIFLGRIGEVSKSRAGLGRYSPNHYQINLAKLAANKAANGAQECIIERANSATACAPMAQPLAPNSAKPGSIAQSECQPTPILEPSENPQKKPPSRRERVDAPPPELPDGLNTEPMRDAWSRYARYRSEQGFKPLGVQAMLARFREFAGWGQPRAIAAIEHSMANGWQGIFEEKHDGSGKSGGRRGAAGVRNAAAERRAAQAAREYD